MSGLLHYTPAEDLRWAVSSVCGAPHVAEAWTSDPLAAWPQVPAHLPGRADGPVSAHPEAIA